MYFIVLAVLLYCFSAASMDNDFSLLTQQMNILEKSLQTLEENEKKGEQEEDNTQLNDLLSNIDENKDAQSEYLEANAEHMNKLYLLMEEEYTKINKILKQNKKIKSQLETITQALEEQKTQIQNADKKIVTIQERLQAAIDENKEIVTEMKTKSNRTQNIVLGAAVIGIGLYIFNTLVSKQASGAFAGHKNP